MAYDAGFDLTFDGNASVTVGSFALTGIGLNSTPFVSKERMAKVIELAANGCLQEEKITQEGVERFIEQLGKTREEPLMMPASIKSASAREFLTAQGYKAIVKRGSWSWCGYVCVGKGHPYYKKHYSDMDDDDLCVHGGITWSNDRVPGIDKGKDEWWLGFDFNHYGDGGGSEELAAVECEILSEQLKEREDGAGCTI